jgi:hypothetical protein
MKGNWFPAVWYWHLSMWWFCDTVPGCKSALSQVKTGVLYITIPDKIVTLPLRWQYERQLIPSVWYWHLFLRWYCDTPGENRSHIAHLFLIIWNCDAAIEMAWKATDSLRYDTGTCPCDGIVTHLVKTGVTLSISFWLYEIVTLPFEMAWGMILALVHVMVLWHCPWLQVGTVPGENRSFIYHYPL